MNWIKSYFQKDEWSPYVAGALLGLVGILAVLLANMLLGASGAFESVAGWIGQKILPSVFNNNYWGIPGTRMNPIMRPEITVSVVLLVGVFFGGMIGALTSKTWKIRLVSDQQWKRIFGPQVWKRWLIAFVGAIILEYAAGIAGGCTSGLAISGGMLLAPAAFLFIMGMFVSGIVTTLLVYRNRY